MTPCFKLPLCLLATALAPYSPATANGGPAAGEPRTSGEALGEWREAHGASWRAVVDPQTGAVELLHGDVTPLGPAPADEHGAVEVAWRPLRRPLRCTASRLRR
jgi:hypothetical protein